MLSRSHPDRIHVAFDNHRLVTNAGLILLVALALRLGLGELVNKHLDQGAVVMADAIIPFTSGFAGTQEAQNAKPLSSGLDTARSPTT